MQVELVTWQGLYPWISGPSLPYNKNPNPNCKPVPGFQNILKNSCSLHEKFSHKKSHLHQPSLNNNAESRNDDHSHSRNSPLTRFIVLMVPVFIFHGTGFYSLFSKVSKLLWSDVWFRFNKFLPSVVQPTAHLLWISVMLQVMDE